MRSWLVSFALALAACGDNTTRITDALVVSASTLELAAGETIAVKATDANDNLPPDVTWSTSRASVARVMPGDQGQCAIHGLGEGTATITATSGDRTATIAVSVGHARLVTIGVTPDALEVAAGTSRQLAATAVYTDATSRDVSGSVMWSSSAPAIAAVDDTGLVAGLAPGAVTITATTGSIGGRATVTVIDATLASIAIAPPDPTIAVGTTVQLAATGTFTDHATRDLTATTAWSSDTPARATVDAAGVVTAVAPGTATITAAYSAFTDTTIVTVP